ncbi:MAG: TrkH family potassium uptake protein, partial [Pseudomonadota bacterium]
MRFLAQLPLMMPLMGGGALAMLVPALVAFAQSDHATARAFFYASILFSLLTALLGLATFSKRNRNNARDHLLTMVAALAFLPLMLAIPVIEAVPDTRFIN